MPNSGLRLIEEIDRTHAASPTLWWLGQCGFAIKYYDIVFYVDPLFDPLMDPVVDARDVHHADLVLCTDAGAEHMDPSTLSAILTASPKAKVVLPKCTADQACRQGIPLSRMTTTDSDLRVEYFKTGIYARIYAVPSARPNLEWTPIGGYPYLGYLLRCGETTIYHAGGCVGYEGLADRLRPYNVKVAVIPIGGGESCSFSAEGAARLASDIGARWLVPMHYQPASASVNGFIDHMLFHKPSQRFKIFEPGEGWQVPDPDPDPD